MNIRSEQTNPETEPEFAADDDYYDEHWYSWRDDARISCLELEVSSSQYKAVYIFAHFRFW